MAGRAIVVMALATLLALAPSVALSQGGGPSAGDKETARDLMTSGDSKYDQGDYAGALADYQAADSIMRVTVTRTAVGRAQAKLGKLLEARATLMTVPNIPEAPDDPEPFRVARHEAAELADALAKRIPSMRFVVRGVPSGTEVRIEVDGQAIPAKLHDVPRKANPGRHSVRANAAGYHAIDQSVELSEGETEEVLLPLVKLNPGESPDPAAGAAIPDPSGREGSGGDVAPVAWVGFGVGAAGLIVGAITGGLAIASAGDLKDSCPNDQCPRAATEDAYDSTMTLAHVSTAGFVVGGAGAILGLVGLLALSGKDEPSTSARHRTTVRVGPTGIALAGSF
jgi:hypothetical protein